MWGLGALWEDLQDADPDAYLNYSRTSNVVYACASLRANMLAALPLRVYKLGAEPKRGRVRTIAEPEDRIGFPLQARGHWLRDAQEVTELETGALPDVLAKVNSLWTLRRLVHMTELSLGLAGQAVWTLERGKAHKATPSAIYYVKHTRMTPHRHPREIISGWTQDTDSPAAQELTTGEVVWLRYPDPADPDYGALPPLAAARLGADVYSAAMKNNWAIFANGLAPGGFIMPPEGVTWGEEQLDEAADVWNDRLAGVEKRHRWLFMPEPYRVEQNTLTPKDAEFLGGLDFSVEDVARAYGIPIELVGGARRTYQNLENAMRAVWMFTMEPEARFVADELTERMVPLFDGEADFVAFDLSEVVALQDDETARWARASEQIASGAITVNEWRADEGLEPVAWGDVAWLPIGTVPVDGPESPVLSQPVTAWAQDAKTREAPTFGDAAHVRGWRARTEETDKLEPLVSDFARGVWRRQRDSMLDKVRASRDVATELAFWERAFDMARWVRVLREESGPVFGTIVRQAGAWLHVGLDIPGTFDNTTPEVVRSLRQQSQRFAVEVNNTTWTDLKATLVEGIEGGEDIRKLSNRVRQTFDTYIADSPGDLELVAKRGRAELIARTETTKAWSSGAEHAARQSGVISKKQWQAAIDERTRDAHLTAHGQTVALKDDFVVDGESGPFPGEFTSASNVCNCRCFVKYVVDRRE